MWPITIGRQPLVFIGPYINYRFGFSLTLIGTILILVRIADFAVDIGIAQISDTVRTPFGRRRPWIVAGLIGFLAAWWYLITDDALTVVGYAAALLLVMTSWTTMFIPYLAQGTEVAQGFEDQGRINIAQSTAALAGTLCSFGIPFLCVDPSIQPLRNAIGEMLGLTSGGAMPPPASGIAGYGTIIEVLVILTTLVGPLALLLYLTCVADSAPPLRQTRGSLLSAARNLLFLRFCAGYLMIMTGYIGVLLMLPFLIPLIFDQAGWLLPLMFVMTVVQIAATPVWSWLFKRLERHSCMALAGALQAAAAMIFAVAPAGSPWLLWAGYIAFGLTGQTLTMGAYLIASDSAVYRQWRTREDGRAIHISFVSITTKVATVCSALLVMGLGLLGLSAKTTQISPTLETGARLVAFVLPALLMISGAALVRGHPITRRRLQALQLRLVRRGQLAPERD